ncbi:MAG: DUF2971 domain-containing protein [Gammaproteobacteria bacterium]|nr:MAG: DUF2971 domain-containing protein [Gammaproteobacteria bacterium]
MQLEYRARRRWLRRRVWSAKHPRHLYKYRSVEPNDQQSVVELRDMVVESVLWMSSPEAFNDPADLQATWVIEGSAGELRTRIDALVKEQEPGLSFKQRERKVLDLMEKPREQLLRGVQVSYMEQRRTFGVCCFARDPRNVLMWSHYANRHKGVCLQYEFARDVPVLARALHVDYLEEGAFQPINWAHAKDMREAIGDTLTRKHKRWEYEGEHRILLEGQAGTYLQLQPSALTGVIFGCHATEGVRGVVLNLLGERDSRGLQPVNLWQAHMDAQARIYVRAAGTAA